ncbi:hypothetical protein [Chitinophaga tropicalis]|uniref:Uncharacterized protein n=1 Tax=Chitinophaga tropicalis TaxID=2683588 RepID=A0A7K1U0D3_9BACT|nr:hypothetical protein [Chitinophaga tropicalis]MVT07756.1 hypothetical protein [Chitinophaga tropicalis]
MFDVVEFSADNFAQALSTDITPPEVIKGKSHFVYLMHYLRPRTEVNAKTIVIEQNYISKDYLHDYADYYSLCFEPYKKVCKRVHLFKNKFSDKQFRNILLSNDPKKQDAFWDNYLGYIVVKPIPVTVIGTTILKTYPHSDRFTGRNYWGLKDYTVHVFGVKRVIRSLVFQEQDKVTAACATTAIWSTLSKVFHDTQSSLKSPSEITRDADKMSQDGSRLFPNKGLSVLQICQAIERAGLVCEVLHTEMDENNHGITTNSYLKELVRAYSSIGIPIIVILQVMGQYHAITLVGHRHQGPSENPSRDKIAFASDNIDRLYAHDDQWGPFARIKFQDERQLVTPWNEIKGATSLIYATDVIVSLYPKIRINYEDIKCIVVALHGIFTQFLKSKAKKGWSWDIRLEYSENYKREVKNLRLDADVTLGLITQSLPRFIWVVTCYGGKERLVDFTFDATGVITGMVGLRVLTFVEVLKTQLHTFIENNEDLLSDYYDKPSASLYRKWLLRETI